MYIYNKKRRTKYKTLPLCCHINISDEIRIKNIYITRIVVSYALRERQQFIGRPQGPIFLTFCTTESTRVVDGRKQVERGKQFLPDFTFFITCYRKNDERQRL